MRDRCELLVFVRSRKVVVAAHEARVLLPLSAGASSPVYLPRRVLQLTRARRLDPDQGDALADARKLAADTATPLRVVDLGTTNVLLRSLRLALLGGRALPIVVFRGPCVWESLRAHRPLDATDGVRV